MLIKAKPRVASNVPQASVRPSRKPLCVAKGGDKYGSQSCAGSRARRGRTCPGSPAGGRGAAHTPPDALTPQRGSPSTQRLPQPPQVRALRHAGLPALPGLGRDVERRCGRTAETPVPGCPGLHLLLSPALPTSPQSGPLRDGAGNGSQTGRTMLGVCQETRAGEGVSGASEGPQAGQDLQRRGWGAGSDGHHSCRAANLYVPGAIFHRH